LRHRKSSDLKAGVVVGGAYDTVRAKQGSGPAVHRAEQKRSMQKKPETIAAKFNSIFTTRMLITLIGALLGVIAARMLGF
jgi:hypothetical protein